MIAGAGEASLRIVPSKLRMQVQVESHGKTTELAIQRLKARREAVADNLCALGAEKQSLNFGAPSVNKVVPANGPGYGTPVPYLTPTPSVIPYAPPAAIPVLPAPAAPPAPSTYAPSGATYAPSGSVPSLPPSTTAPGTLVPVPAATLEATPDAGPRPAATEPATPLPAPTPPAVAPAAPPSTFAPPSAPASPAVPVSPYPATTSPYVPPADGPIAPTQPRSPRSAGPTELYAATATLTIEWPLKAETVEQAVLAAEAIRKKVAAGNLMGGKAAEKLPADEQELLDEQPIAPRATSQLVPRAVVETLPDGRNVTRYVSQEVVTATGPGGLFPGGFGPTPFLYVATISSPQRKALLAEAFGNAKSQAAELAEATGGKLGAIRSVGGEVSNSKPCDRIIVSSPIATPSILAPNENRNEATAADPGDLKFYAKVHALFRLE
jgi:hypothetical protein